MPTLKKHKCRNDLYTMMLKPRKHGCQNSTWSWNLILISYKYFFLQKIFVLFPGRFWPFLMVQLKGQYIRILIYMKLHVYTYILNIYNYQSIQIDRIVISLFLIGCVKRSFLLPISYRQTDIWKYLSKIYFYCH